ncbi:olfactory receptor 10A7-like [Terrapene carolina triunguis]|uniref:olfactory receptor 10A7-like n=1 Tax=Terrapene triunguis TaxID=2587831 RepID=UPI000CEF6FCF|nr:olfactory receptor 10A7-like [Terrapene carolina triunguis]
MVRRELLIWKLNSTTRCEELAHGNSTAVSEFIILGFSSSLLGQVLLFLMCFAIYTLTLLGNSLIVLITLADPSLHISMYFFIGNLSFLEICYSSVTLPKMMAISLTGDNTISFTGCAAQMYFFLLLGSAECYLLAAMAYDRYVAICHPLRYVAIMERRSCVWLVAGSWLSGIPVSFIQTTLVFTSPFCGPNKINHFFCDVAPVLQLVCADTSRNEMSNITVTVVFLAIPFTLILISYTCIIATVLKMSSPGSRHRAFSTCSSHLVVVTLFYGSGMVMYLRPRSSHTTENDKLLSLFYTVVTPMLNPVIYSLRNEEVKGALRRRVAGKRLSPLQ